VKRFFDLTLIVLSLPVLMPVFIVVAVLVRVKLGDPVFFSQERPGKDAKPFKMFKFRTMTYERDEKGELLPDSLRLTKFGKFLRSTSLDELPGLWSVFKGDMSLVGPRPLLMEYLDYYTDDEMIRHVMQPGLTGLAQVSGRNNLGWDERLAVDIEYVKNWSFWLDIKILFLTFKKVILKEDVVVVPSSKFGKLSDIRRDMKRKFDAERS
jgi:lipopolysaccharide/colanic/teichoic acid biosynthesis glycosyltransferase